MNKTSAHGVIRLLQKLAFCASAWLNFLESSRYFSTKALSSSFFPYFLSIPYPHPRIETDDSALQVACSLPSRYSFLSYSAAASSTFSFCLPSPLACPIMIAEDDHFSVPPCWLATG